MATVDSLVQPSHEPAASRGSIGMYAGFVTRATAFVLDIAILTVAVLLINVMIGLPVAVLMHVDLTNCAQYVGTRAAADRVACYGVNAVWIALALLAGPIYFLTLFTITGQTIGKYVMGVRIVRLDGRPMTVKTSFVRWVGYLVSILTLGLGFLWIIVDNRRQGFHDHMAKTSVIYAWRATGSVRLLSRVNAWFAARGIGTAAAALPAPTPALPPIRHVELLALASLDLSRIGGILATLRTLSAKAETGAPAVELWGKTAAGQVGRLRTEQLPATVDLGGLSGLPASVQDAQVRTLAGDVPPGSYVLVLAVDEPLADALVLQVVRGGPVTVGRYAPRDSTGSGLPPTGS